MNRIERLKNLQAEYQAIENCNMPVPFRREHIWKAAQELSLKIIRQEMANIIRISRYFSNEDGKHLCPECNKIEQPSPFSEYEAKHPHLVGNCLVLKTGEYGKFWGCETFKATGCKCTRDTTEQAEEKLHNNLMAAVYRDAGGPF